MDKTIRIILNDINKIKQFVEDASSFASNIDIHKHHYVVDGKSLMGIISIDPSEPIDITINAIDSEEEIRFEEVFNKYKIEA